jgi:hypothetical protein
LISIFTPYIDLDLHAVRVVQEQLTQAVRVRDVPLRRHPVLRQPREQLVVVRRVERNVVDRAGARGFSRHGDVELARMGRVGAPLRDVDARHVAEIEPVAWKPEWRAEAVAKAEHAAIEIPRSIDVVGEDEEMFHLRERHGPSLGRSGVHR